MAGIRFLKCAEEKNFCCCVVVTCILFHHHSHQFAFSMSATYSNEEQVEYVMKVKLNIQLDMSVSLPMFEGVWLI